MGICVIASIKFDNPLNWIGPNLSSSQVTIGATQSPTPGQMTPFSSAQLATLTTRVNTLATSDDRVRGEQVPHTDSAARMALPGPIPLTAAQLSAVRQFGHANEVQVQTATYNPSLAEFTHGATALGIVIALSVLAMSVGLIRSETAPDLRTLTAAGASGMTRRTITAATAAALGLLGMAGVVIAGIAWTHSGLTATADGVPPSDLLILLIGLPLVAAIGGWLFAVRKPPAVARQPLE
jgi:hypothetical protein